MNFRIPDFPLGALFTATLFGVGLLFMFPDFPSAWLWEILLLIACIVWALGAGFLDNRTRTPDETEPTKDQLAEGVSSDFRALINTIAAQGRANRQEERKEDRSKRLREQITIIIIGITMAAVILQVREMIKVYEPIRQQAEAAADQARAALIQADIAKQAAANVHEDTILAQRAWIGVTGATTESGPPASGSDMKLLINYANSGRQPAVKLYTGIENFVGTLDDFDTQVKLNRNSADCMQKSPAQSGQVVYPTTGFTSYQLRSTLSKSQIDDQIIKGDKVVFLIGCFAYQTFDSPHHSAFCFFYKTGMTSSPNLNFCGIGNNAD